jgi:hypothetical protein
MGDQLKVWADQHGCLVLASEGNGMFVVPPEAVDQYVADINLQHKIVLDRRDGVTA